MINKLDLQTINSEFASHWVSYRSDLVQQLSKI